MRFHRFATKLTVMFVMAAFLLSVFAPVALCMDATEEEHGTQETQTDADGEIISEEFVTDENGEILPSLPQYIIVENTTADPEATTQEVTEEPTTLLYETVTDESGEAVTDENGEVVTELVTEELPTDENGEVITTEPPTEPVTEPPVPDALSENGLLLTIMARDADYGYRIVIPKDCADETGYAAGLLQTTLQKMTGVLLPIVSDSASEQDREICLGDTNRTGKAPVGVSENGFYLHVKGERLYLYALGEQGAIYAVTAFLREVCGCRWFASGQTEIPVVQTLSVPANLSLQRGVYFAYNETFSDLTDASFLQMNSLSGGAYTFVSSDGTHARTYLTPCESTLGTLFVPAQEYFGTHPEYFALYNNERNPSQLCLSNWDVYSLVLQKTQSVLRSEWVPTKNRQVICLSLPSNDVVCQCPECAALTAQNGSYAGVLLTFLNRVSAGLYAEGYHNLQIETVISDSLFAVPTAVTPAHNITLRLSAEKRCVSHPLTHGSCENNRWFLSVFKAWRQYAPTVYVDLPTENIAHTIGIFADFKPIQSDVQTLYYLGADGICAADNENARNCGPEFRALRSYLLAQLFADPYCDLKAEKLAFLKSWYGDGYKQIAQILDLFSEHAGDADGHLYITSSPENSLTLSSADVQSIDRLWNEAAALCADGRQLLHLEQSRLAWRFWQACCSQGAFSEDNSITDATRVLMENLQAAGVNRYSVQNETLNLSFLSRTLRPQDWNTPVLTLLQPVFTTLRKVLTAVLVLSLLVLSATALWRKKILLLLPLWGFVVTTAIFPWHTESIANHAWGSAVLTAVVPLFFVFLLTSLSVYIKYNDVPRTDILKKLFTRKNNDEITPSQEESISAAKPSVQGKKQIFLLSVISLAVCAAVYFALLFMPLYAAVTGSQCAPLAAVVLCLQMSVCSCILCIRFVLKEK